MAELHKRILAREDLIAIWLYSFERWGDAQADTYLDHLEKASPRYRTIRGSVHLATTSGQATGASTSNSTWCTTGLPAIGSILSVSRTRTWIRMATRDVYTCSCSHPRAEQRGLPRNSINAVGRLRCDRPSRFTVGPGPIDTGAEPRYDE